MLAEIISIGTEITTGSTLNTNSFFIAGKLLEVGIETTYQTSVDDNIDRIKTVLEIAFSRADIIITTGGLGPTEDDLTKETVAEFLGLNLNESVDEKNKIIDKLKNYKTIPVNNFKQAKLIEGGKFLNNVVGTASGIYLNHNNKIIILLPGPPREMEPMFLNEVIPKLNGINYSIIKKSVNLCDIGESYVESQIKDLINMYEDIEVATFGKIQDVEIKMIGRGTDGKKLSDKIDGLIGLIEKRFPNNIYAYNNKPIEKIVLELLEKFNLKISFSESCTGGLLSGKFIRQSGVSSVYDYGVVTYSNDSKIVELNVSKSIIDKYGAVSKETSIAMVKGLLLKKRADIGVSITGIAGPNSDNTKKPVGLVYVSVGNESNIVTKELRYSGDRKNIQNRVVDFTFFEIRKFIINNY